jgi:hypothetical protein
MNLLKVLLVGFVSFNCIVSFGQTKGFSFGYVVTTEGDTIRGELKYKNKYTYTQRIICKYGDDEKKTFNYKNALFFSADDENYELHEVKGIDDKVFLRKHISGAISFFEYNYELMQMNKIVVKSENYVKADKADELIKISGGNFKKVLSDLMMDEPTIVDRINQKDTKFEDVRSIISSYNGLKK